MPKPGQHAVAKTASWPINAVRYQAVIARTQVSKKRRCYCGKSRRNDLATGATLDFRNQTFQCEVSRSSKNSVNQFLLEASASHGFGALRPRDKEPSNRGEVADLQSYERVSPARPACESRVAKCWRLLPSLVSFGMLSAPPECRAGRPIPSMTHRTLPLQAEPASRNPRVRIVAVTPLPQLVTTGRVPSTPACRRRSRMPTKSRNVWSAVSSSV